MRVAKIIETTKKLNISVRKIIKNKTQKISLNPEHKESYLNKGRRNNKLTLKKDLKLAMKYMSDFDNFNGQLEYDENFNDSFNFNIENVEASSRLVLRPKSGKKVKYATTDFYNKTNIKKENLVVPERRKASIKVSKNNITNMLSIFKSDKTLLSLFQSNSKSKISSSEKESLQKRIFTEKSRNSTETDKIFMTYKHNNVSKIIDDRSLSYDNTSSERTFLDKEANNFNSRRQSYLSNLFNNESVYSKENISNIPIESRRASQFSEINYFVNNPPQPFQQNRVIQKIVIPNSNKRASVLLSYIPKFVPEIVKEEDDEHSKLSNITESNEIEAIKKIKPRNKKQLKHLKNNSITFIPLKPTIDIFNRLLTNSDITKEENVKIDYEGKFPLKIKKDFATKFTLQVENRNRKKNNYYSLKSSSSSNHQISEELSESDNNTSYAGAIKTTENEPILINEANKEEVNVDKKRSFSLLKFDSLSNSENKSSNINKIREFTKEKENNSFVTLNKNRLVNRFETNNLHKRNAKSIISISENESDIMEPREEKLFNNRVYKLAKLKESLNKIVEDTEKNETEEDKEKSKSMTLNKQTTITNKSFKNSRRSIISNFLITDPSKTFKFEEEQIKVVDDHHEDDESEADSFNLSLLSVNYDTVVGLETPDAIAQKRNDKLIVESMLYRRLTLKIVILFMMIIIALQLTQTDYLQ